MEEIPERLKNSWLNLPERWYLACGSSLAIDAAQSDSKSVWLSPFQ
jgi:hypothetical protein